MRGSTSFGRSSIEGRAGRSTSRHLRIPLLRRDVCRRFKYRRRSRYPGFMSPRPSLCARLYMYWYMDSCEMDSSGCSRVSLPATCSGERPDLRPQTTYRLTNPLFNRSFLPRLERFRSARSWATRGVYRFMRGGLLLRISLDTDDGFRSISLAMLLIDAFCQSNSCIFSRSSIEICLNVIHLIFYQVLQLLVEPMPNLPCRFWQNHPPSCSIQASVWWTA